MEDNGEKIGYSHAMQTGARSLKATAVVAAFAILACSTIALASDLTEPPNVLATIPAADQHALSAQLYHSGGFYPLLRGDAYVGAEAARRFNPFSFNPQGDVGDYDDGPRCAFRRGGGFLFGYQFVHTCR